jgi:phage-related protein
VTRSGRATIEIVGDVSKFATALKRDLDRLIKGVKVDTRPVGEQISKGVGEGFDKVKEEAAETGEKIGDELDKGAKKASRSLGEIDRAAERAFRKIDAEARKATRGIDRDLDQLAKDQERNFEELDDAIGDAFDGAEEAAEDAFEGATRASDRGTRTIRQDLRAVDSQIEQVQRSIREMAREFARTGDANIHVDITGERQALAKLQRIRSALGDVSEEGRKGRSILSSAGVAITSIGSALVGLGAAAPTPAGIVAIGAALLALGAAIPVVIALGAALADLAGLLPVLPAAAAIAAAAFISLKLALNGVGDAFKAVLDGDPDKIAEALKKLAPAAQNVVREFQKLLPALRGTQRLIQQDFFAPLEGGLTRLVKQALPTVRVGLAGIGESLGELGARLLRLLGGSQALGFLRGVFTQTKAVVDRVTESVGSVLNIVFRLGNAGLPLIQKFVDWMLDGVDALSAFLSSADGKTALNDFLSDAVATLKDLWALAGAVGNLLGAMFGGADDEGRTFIQTLTDITNRMAEFFNSKQGQEFLQNLLDLLPLVAFALQQFAVSVRIVGLHINALVVTFNAIKDFLIALPGWVSTAAQAVGGWFAAAWTAASAAVAAFIAAVGAWFVALPGRFAGWLAAAGAAIMAGIRFAFDAALAYVGVTIGLIIFAVARLPGMALAALASLPGVLAGVFTAAWNNARTVTTAAAAAIVAYTAGLIGRIGSALAALPGIIGGAFRTALASARAAVTSGFNAIVSFAASVPGRLSGLAGRFLSAGRAIIAGFFRGLSSGSGFAGNVGSAIVSSIRSGLNGVIGRINAGIAAIDARLPGSLPRIPGLATGGLTTNDMLARLHPNELVLPLTDRRAVDLLSAAMRRADNTGDTASPGILQSGDVEVRVFIGDRELTDIVDVQISEHNRTLKRRVTAGAGT